jgi:hypothetical protein
VGQFATHRLDKATSIHVNPFWPRHFVLTLALRLGTFNYQVPAVLKRQISYEPFTTKNLAWHIANAADNSCLGLFTPSYLSSAISDEKRATGLPISVRSSCGRRPVASTLTPLRKSRESLEVAHQSTKGQELQTDVWCWCRAKGRNSKFRRVATCPRDLGVRRRRE